MRKQSRPGAMLFSIVPFAALLISAVAAVTPRRPDDGALQIHHNASASAEHCPMLTRAIEDIAEGAPDALQTIGHNERLVIIDYVHVAEGNGTQAASRLIQERFDAMNTTDQRLLLSAVHRLGVGSIATDIMSTKRTWADVATIRDMLHDDADAFWFVMGCSPVLARLRQMAQNDPKATAIVKQVHDLVAFGGNASFVTDTLWDKDFSLLHRAAHNGEDMVIEVLARIPGVDVNSNNCRDFWWTPLHLAALRGHTQVARTLLATPGIAINNARQYHKMTPLHVAAFSGFSNVTRLLLRSTGIKVNERDHRGLTPLHWAARKGHVANVDMLLQVDGVSVDALTHANETALKLAESQRRYDVVAMLQEKRPQAGVLSCVMTKIRNLWHSLLRRLGAAA